MDKRQRQGKYPQQYSIEQRLLTLSQMKENYEQAGKNQMMMSETRWNDVV